MPFYVCLCLQCGANTLFFLPLRQKAHRLDHTESVSNVMFCREDTPIVNYSFSVRSLIQKFWQGALFIT